MHSISHNKTLLKFYALVLGLAVLIYGGTGDLTRALTALLAFSPYAFVRAKSTAVSAAIRSLGERGIRIRTGGAPERLSHMENIAFTTEALAPAGTMQTDAPQLIARLRSMGMHPVLLAPVGTKGAAQLAAQADIRDIRTALPPLNDPFAVSTALVQKGSEHRSTTEESCLHIVLGSSAGDAPILCTSDDLSQLPLLLRTARQLRQKIEQNAVFGYTLNFIGIGLAAAGILSPFAGALWHAASTGLVLLNAESLRSTQVHEKKFAFSKAL